VFGSRSLALGLVREVLRGGSWRSPRPREGREASEARGGRVAEAPRGPGLREGGEPGELQQRLQPCGVCVELGSEERQWRAGGERRGRSKPPSEARGCGWVQEPWQSWGPSLAPAPTGCCHTARHGVGPPAAAAGSAAC